VAGAMPISRLDPGGYAGFMLLKGLNDLTSVNFDFLMVFEIKGISLLSKVCILGVLTLPLTFCSYPKVAILSTNVDTKNCT
jgi:hypothetical protein